jgi:uncharacterized repeat protein (TIGR01451 family)
MTKEKHMFALHKIHAALFSLLFIVLALLAFNARAALPDAGTSIGTKAVVTFSMGGIEGTSTSNLVATTIAHVYATEAVALNATILAQPKSDADMRFAISNIGNGEDDVVFFMRKFPMGIDEVKVSSVDGNGVPVNEVTLKQGEEFKLPAMARDQIRNVVVRAAVPLGAKENDDYKFDFEAKNKGKDIVSVTSTVRVVAVVPFDVEAGAPAILDARKEALIAFNVDGKSASSGYFELIVAKKSDLSRTAVAFDVMNEKISFDNNDIAAGKIAVGKDMTAFVVDTMPVNLRISFKMKIHVPNANIGDEYVMFVKYGAADANKIASVGSQLTTSTEVQISYPHTVARPVLEVTRNSSGNAVPATIEDAVSGNTYYYDLTLENKSTKAESFSLELNNAKAKSIRNMTFEDKNGNAFSSPGGSGLPETGLIPVGEKISFRVKVDLVHATPDATKQEIKVIAKSIKEKTASASAILLITSVKNIDPPAVTFFADKDLKQKITNVLKVPGRDNFASFYMQVEAPDVDKKNTPREYNIKFNQARTTFQMLTGTTTGSEFKEMKTAIGHGVKAKVFLVKVDMRNHPSVKETATATDVLGQVGGTGSIVMTKQAAVEFAEQGYAANGSADLDTVLTVDVINRGGGIDAGDYEVLAGDNPTAKDWKIAFSTDGSNWQSDLKLDAMIPLASQSLQVKITVPRNADAGISKSLNLVLRKMGQAAGGEKIESTTVVTVAIGKSQLEIVKKLFVVKDAGNKSTGKPLPSAFSVSTGDEVEHADSIWYQVTVTNPFDAPVAKNVIITDPLPKHSVFVAGSADAGSAGTPAQAGNNIALTVDEMQPNSTVTMVYRVTIKLK